MNDFIRGRSSQRIPIYLEKLPKEVVPVSLRLVVFVGSADDQIIGEPGINHWFEHVPNRGTKKFPGGYTDTKSRFSFDGGKNGAYTDKKLTVYHAYVPKEKWNEGLELIVDLMGQPLLNEDGIIGERKIITEERNEKLSTLEGHASFELETMLWGDHPLAHPILGTEYSLHTMTPDLLRRAHKANYSQSRCVLIVAGNVELSDVEKALSTYAEVIPDTKLSVRHSAKHYEPLPLWQPGITTVETAFKSSLVYMLFPVQPLFLDEHTHYKWLVLNRLLSSGSLGSPLYRLLREETNMVYHTDTVRHFILEGGYWGLKATSSSKHIPQILEAFRKILNDPVIRSKDWFEKVKRSVHGDFRMRLQDPHQITLRAADSLQIHQKVVTEVQIVEEMTHITHEEILEFMEQVIDINTAKTLVFKGQKD